jgi:cell wall-associated NlpC family hydrolase
MAKKNGGGAKAAALVLGGLLVAHYMPSHGHLLSASAGTPSAAASRAVGYAWAQVGRPYCWGGTGPSCYDCSGLAMEAYSGSIPRTSQAQWAALPHVSSPQPGDLVYAPGSDGTASSPGHVGLVISGGRVIQAYATGSPVNVVSLSAFAAGAGGIVGYARPGGA